MKNATFTLKRTELHHQKPLGLIFKYTLEEVHMEPEFTTSGLVHVFFGSMWLYVTPGVCSISSDR